LFAPRPYADEQDGYTEQFLNPLDVTPSRPGKLTKSAGAADIFGPARQLFVDRLAGGQHLSIQTVMLGTLALVS
jgi:hypothetical protein